MTDKQPQTCYVVRRPICEVKLTKSEEIYLVYESDIGFDICNKLDSVYIYTPEELEALKVKWMREAAEKVFKDLDIPSQINGSPNRYLDQHYPLPQPINTNL